MKVLIAVDGEFGNAVIEFVCKHAWSAETVFRILHVVEPVFLPAVSGYPTDVLLDAAKEKRVYGKALAVKLGKTLRERFPEHTIEEQVLDGPVREVILDLAQEWSADMIILGSHGKNGLDQFLLGSVSNAVLQHAKCSVVLVKPVRPLQSKSEPNKTAVHSV